MSLRFHPLTRKALTLMSLGGVFLMAAASLVFAAPDLSTTIAELKLTNGQVLHEVTIKAYNSKGVMARCSEGVMQLAYAQFPEEYQEALLAKKPPEIAATPSPAQTKQKSQTARSNDKSKPGVMISGTVRLSQGSRPVPVSGVEIRAYPTFEFARFDLRRRQTFIPEHNEVRRRLLTRQLDQTVSSEEMQKFYADEYQSWDGLPYTPCQAHSDENGNFEVSVPANTQDILIFARVEQDLPNAHGYYVWAMRTFRQHINLDNGNLYPVLRGPAE